MSYNSHVPPTTNIAICDALREPPSAANILLPLMKSGIPALTGLRGIAALWVLLYHAMILLKTTNPALVAPLKLLLGAGYLGVDIFFVLSGFVLAYNYADVKTHRSVSSYSKFLWMRLARIYPVHVAALVLMSISMLLHFSLRIPYSTDHSAESLFESLALIHGWSVPIFGKWNAPSWSLSAEWAAYLAFPLVAVVAMRMRSQALLILSVVSLFAILSLLMYLTPGNNAMQLGMYRIATEFTSGVFLFRLWSLSPKRSNIADQVAMASLIVMLSLSGYLDYAYRDDTALVWLAPLSGILVLFLASAKGAFSALLSSNKMQYLGKISYSLYMVHFSFLVLAKNYIAHEFTTLPVSTALIITAAFLVTSFACAHWFYVSIEEPSRRWMASLYRRGKGEAGAVKAAV